MQRSLNLQKKWQIHLRQVIRFEMKLYNEHGGGNRRYNPIIKKTTRKEKIKR